MINSISIQDKKKGNRSVYKIIGCGLKIRSFTYDNAGYVIDWRLVTEEDIYDGETVDELKNTLKELIIKYDLQQYSKCKSDCLVIYTNNINKVFGFLMNDVTETFPKYDLDKIKSGDEKIKKLFYFKLYDFIEIRDISCWNKDVKSTQEISDFAKYLIDEIFVPEQYFYITPNQRPRRKIKQALKANNQLNEVTDLFPEDYNEYNYLKMGLFGGLCYCLPMDKAITEPMLAIDLDSAYIRALLTEKHVCSKFETDNPNNWEYYLYSSNKCSIGRYTIKFNSWSSKCACYKDYKGNKLDSSIKEATFVMDNIDLKIFISLVNVEEIKCHHLKVADIDYLPKPIRDVIVDEYTKKLKLKEFKDLSPKDKLNYILQKSVINGIYGDTIRKLNQKDYKYVIQELGLIPQWGIWTTSYCKKYLIEVANNVDGWYYSDTDSIYCKDTKDNRRIIEEFNYKTTNIVNDFCAKFDYDYDILKNIGSFDIEAEIVKFKSITTKRYMYLTKEGKMVLKAAGCNKEEVTVDESLFDLDDIPIGTKTFGLINPNCTKLVVGDKVYISDGSYYEKQAAGEDALELMKLFVMECE